jgi:hypothetical protein
MSLIERALLAAHLFCGAAWFGALVYRTFFVDPKSLRYFARGRDFETYSLHLSDGMRYVVLLSLAASGLSGFALILLRWDADAAWQARMAAKAGLWALAFAVFAYVSWVYWPRRVFATEAEWPGVRARGLALSLVMIAIAALGMLLGQWGRG